MNSIEDGENPESHLVLRTVYIKKSVDDKLRELGFRLKRSKNDIIRRGIDLALEELEQKFSRQASAIPISK